MQKLAFRNGVKKKSGGVVRQTSLWRCGIRLAVVAAGLGMVSGIAFADAGFPFEKDLILDVRPMKGSKRVPVIEIGNGGAAVIDLWCDRMQGRAIVSGDSITIMPGPREGAACPPDRAKADEDMIEALQQVTGWRRSGTNVTLTGPQTLKFRLPTH